MKRVLRPLLILHPDAGLRSRVRGACDDEYAVHELPDWEALEQALTEAPPSAMLLVDPLEDGGTISPRLRALVQAYRSTPVVAAMPVSAGSHALVRELGECGVVQVIAIGHDDTVVAIRSRLRAARGRPMRALLDEVLPPETSGRARAIIAAAADVVTMGENSGDLADALNLSRRTLLRWSHRAGLPPPRHLLAWMRILLACALLDDPGRSVLTVARTAGYASDSGLRRVTQKFLRASPTELREEGAVRRAAAAFVEVLRESRMAVRATTREG